MSTIYAQSLIDRVLSRFGPPIAASVVIALAVDVSMGLIALVTILCIDGLFQVRRYPLHLVPLARYLFSVFVPAAGIAFVYLLGQVGLASISLDMALLALAAASSVSLVALWAGDRFAADRPIRTAVIGQANFACRLRAELTENNIRSYELVGYVDDEPAAEESDTGLRRLGGISEIRTAAEANQIDLLVIGPEKPRLQIFEETAKACLGLHVRMIEATALYESVLGHVPIGVINAAWFQYIMHPLYSPSSPLSKRLLDVFVSAVMLIFLSPLLALCALAVKLDDRGPVLYRQRRLGEEGREFNMVKFRTLRPDADQLLSEGRPETQLITRAGRVLRKGHLNELPQLLQVLHGEMSLVGPRPEPPEFVEALGGSVPHYDRRALVKPGLTGWAQVRCGYAGSRIGTAWKTCHDLYYIKHRSVGLDLVILLQTIPALVERAEIEQVPAPDFILGDATELIAP
jgi:exopolysaccharide biosynthesis polyprenyl glycosylphosphotransferase